MTLRACVTSLVFVACQPGRAAPDAVGGRLPPAPWISWLGACAEPLQFWRGHFFSEEQVRPRWGWSVVCPSPPGRRRAAGWIVRATEAGYLYQIDAYGALADFRLVALAVIVSAVPPTMFVPLLATLDASVLGPTWPTDPTAYHDHPLPGFASRTPGRFVPVMVRFGPHADDDFASATWTLADQLLE